MKLTTQAPRAEIPTASMADVAFLLIIFFMVTTAFSAAKGLKLALPEDDRGRPAEAEEAVFIRVLPDASITVDCRAVEPEGLLDYLEPKLTRQPQKPVVLYTDPDAPYGAMIAVYDVLAQAQESRGFAVKNVSVPTQSEIQEYIELYGLNPFEQSCP
jgi:biopolymer transport protein ExbD